MLDIICYRPPLNEASAGDTPVSGKCCMKEVDRQYHEWICVELRYSA